jgi:hypothetical protein
VVVKKVVAGTRFRPSARAWNAFADKANELTPSMSSSSSIGKRLLVLNNSGTDCNRFGILGVDGMQIPQATNENEFYNNILLDGVSPVLADHCGKFVVCVDPIKDGRIGECIMSGLIQVQVNMVDADDNWCDIKAATFDKLESYGAGSAQIIHKPSGTGVKWCLVNLAQSYGPATMYRGLQVGDLLAVDPDNVIDNLVAMDGVPVETTSVTASNLMGWAADDNAITYIKSQSFGTWEMIQVACPAE